MFNFDFLISNPYSDRFGAVAYHNGLIGNDGAWEFNIYKTNDILGLSLSIRTRCDHAGTRLTMSLAGYMIEFYVYNMKRWNGNETRYD